jgi:hypothetical protein
MGEAGFLVANMRVFGFEEAVFISQI